MGLVELPEDTVRQIAAGEVVERPASAVKELVENGLDAGATRIDVEVNAGGTERIRVADDGEGMTAGEVRLAVEKHTTSKIADAADLDSIATLGFRGEALYAIGSVSRMTVTTTPAGGDRGTELRVVHGEVEAVEPAGRPPGTTVVVEDLFGSTPARREFLRTDATEFDHVGRIVTRYALANPDVAVSLSHDGRSVLSTPGDGDLGATVLAVYGREVAESMIPVEAERVSGLVSHPEVTRAGREYLSTFVNGRYVRSSPLREAVVSAYGDQLAPDRYPFAVVFLDLDPSGVDVNVHPRKLEVRFDDERGVTAAVRSAVADALLDHGLVRSGAPRGRSAPAETAVAPAVTDDDTVPSGIGRPRAGAAGPDPAHGAPAGERTPEPGGFGRVRDAGEQTTLDGDPAGHRTAFDRLPALSVLGQLHGTFLVCETDDGLVLLDQHAADERVNYERLKDRLVEGATQRLAEPVVLELTARERALFPAYREALERLGFRAAVRDDRSVEVTAVPAVFTATLDPGLLRDALSTAIDAEPAESVEARADAVLADLACYPSITGNTPLTDGSMRGLLEALDGCDNPYACPHGRPVVVEISKAELDDRFERDYPGHRHRRPE